MDKKNSKKQLGKCANHKTSVSQTFRAPTNKIKLNFAKFESSKIRTRPMASKGEGRPKLVRNSYSKHLPNQSHLIS